MKKLRFIIMGFIAFMLIPTIASAAYTYEGSDDLHIRPLFWTPSKTFYTRSGSVTACVSGVDNPLNTYAIDAYEDDGFAGSSKLGVIDVNSNPNRCVTFPTSVFADGDNGKAEVFFRIGNVRYSDSSITLQVYVNY